jgi:hypothetical protein
MGGRPISVLTRYIGEMRHRAAARGCLRGNADGADEGPPLRSREAAEIFAAAEALASGTAILRLLSTDREGLVSLPGLPSALAQDGGSTPSRATF